MPRHTGPKMSGLPGAAAFCAEPSSKHVPAALFREKIIELADEYERVQATLYCLLQQRADGLIGDGPRADAPLSEGRQAADAESTRDSPLSVRPATRVAGALATRASDEASIAPPGEEGGPRAESQEEHAPCFAQLLVGGGSLQDEWGQVASEPDEAMQNGSASAAGNTRPRLDSKRSTDSSLGERPQHDWQTDFFLYVAHSKVFQRFIGIIIVMHVIFLGVATDVSMSSVVDDSSDTVPAYLQVTEAGFLGIYAVELTIRLMAFRKKYFLDQRERLWNIFDMALVVQGVIEQVMSMRTNNPLGGGGNLSFLRAMRLLKTVKMLRVVRLMRSMKELRMIMYAVMGSAKSMVWSCVLLGAVLYMMSIICVQGVVGHLQTVDADEREDGTHDAMLKYWGSVPLGMLTLFMSTTGGADWVLPYEALCQAAFSLGVAFLAYLSFFLFVITNAITSIFVEAVMENASNDWFNRVQEQLENKRTYVDTLRRLFRKMDASNDGVVNLEEFECQLEDPHVSAFFATLGIKVSDAVRFFNMLSQDGTVNVDLDRFIDFCIRMSGPAQSIDLAEVSITQCILQKDVRDAKLMQEAHLAATHRVREEVIDHILRRYPERNDGPQYPAISGDRSDGPHLGGMLTSRRPHEV